VSAVLSSAVTPPDHVGLGNAVSALTCTPRVLPAMDHHGMLLLSISYQLLRCLLGLVTVLVRRDLSKDVELLVLRHENAVLR
jgi:hypothetical protein